MVVVNRFYKMAYFVNYNKTLDTSRITNLHFQEIVKLHGIPRTTVFFFYFLFLSRFKLLNLRFSYHPQKNGQIEVINQSLRNLLWCYVGKDIEKWDPVLDHIKFAYNQSTNQTAGCSPFESIYGKNPISPLDLSPLLTLIILVGMLKKGYATLGGFINKCRTRFISKLISIKGLLTSIKDMLNLRKEIWCGFIFEKNIF